MAAEDQAPVEQVTIVTNEEIVRHHAPDEDGIRRITNIRAATKAMLDAIDDNCPRCADSTFAKRQVRMAMMSANASIALDGKV